MNIPIRLKKQARLTKQRLLQTGAALVIALTIGLTAAAFNPGSLLACGGFFCTTIPVDQAQERIVFAQNENGILDVYIQIDSENEDPTDFSWILPVPLQEQDGEDIRSTFQVTTDEEEGGINIQMFDELDAATATRILAPALPECARNNLRMESMASSEAIAMSAQKSVEVLAEGNAGPYRYQVLRAAGEDILVPWLEDNGYTVVDDNKPIIEDYVDGGFDFLALQLRAGRADTQVKPIKVSYKSRTPMIPIKLTAVAATDDMPIIAWLFGSSPYEPSNYQEFSIDNTEIFFDNFGNDNFDLLRRNKADGFDDGQAWLAEYRQETGDLENRNSHPIISKLKQRHPWVTRYYTQLSPHEMTKDPVFQPGDTSLPKVSNLRDLRQMTGRYQCERDEGASVSITDLPGEIGGITLPGRPSVDREGITLPGIGDQDTPSDVDETTVTLPDTDLADPAAETAEGMTDAAPEAAAAGKDEAGTMLDRLLAGKQDVENPINPDDIRRAASEAAAEAQDQADGAVAAGRDAAGQFVKDQAAREMRKKGPLLLGIAGTAVIGLLAGVAAVVYLLNRRKQAPEPEPKGMP